MSEYITKMSIRGALYYLHDAQSRADASEAKAAAQADTANVVALKSNILATYQALRRLFDDNPSAVAILDEAILDISTVG